MTTKLQLCCRIKCILVICIATLLAVPQAAYSQSDCCGPKAGSHGNCSEHCAIITFSGEEEEGFVELFFVTDCEDSGQCVYWATYVFCEFECEPCKDSESSEVADVAKGCFLGVGGITIISCDDCEGEVMHPSDDDLVAINATCPCVGPVGPPQ